MWSSNHNNNDNKGGVTVTGVTFLKIGGVSKCSRLWPLVLLIKVGCR